MKLKITLLALTAAIFSTSSFASHLMGGQITAKQISGLQYQVKLVVYRDTIGIPMYATTMLHYTALDSTNTWSTTATRPHGGATVLINGVEEYTYTDTINFPTNGSYSIRYDDCCRNAAIVNMSSPGGESFYLTTIVTVDSSSSNSTPVFLNAPVTLAQLNNMYAYNPLPFDADGDSLSWSLVTPLSSNASPVSGYVLPHANPLFPFTLDAATGAISWMPDMMGNFVSSFLVEEFRGGVKIGEIRRDMQILVINDTTNSLRAAVSTTGWPTNASGNFSFNLPASSAFNLTVVAMDGNNDLLSMQANGAPFALATNPAYYSTASGLGIASCDISWTPTLGQINTTPYNIAFRILERHGVYTFVSDKTVQFVVNDALGVKDVAAGTSVSDVYPNPSNGSFFVPFNLESAAQVKVEVLNANGQVVSTLANKTMNAGKNVILNTNSSLSKGIYTVAVWVDGKKLSTKKLVITE
jgi:hypothetical protein